MSKKQKYDPSKINLVVVEIAAGLPSPLPTETLCKVAAQDIRWNPFTRLRAKELFTTPKLHHEVKVTELHAPMGLLIVYAKELRTYFRKYPERLARSDDMLKDIAKMQDHEIVYYINTWLAIAKHFGNSVPYRREFMDMMRPLPGVMDRSGLF